MVKMTRKTYSTCSWEQKKRKCGDDWQNWTDLFHTSASASEGNKYRRALRKINVTVTVQQRRSGSDSQVALTDVFFSFFYITCVITKD